MTSSEMNFEIKNPAIEEKLRNMGRIFKSVMPEGYGFMLMIFSYEGHELSYISSAERDGVLKTMKEFIEKEEARAKAGT